MKSEKWALIEEFVREELQGLPEEIHDPATGHPLTVTPFGPDEVLAAMETLLSTRLTMGERTRAFEAAWAAWCGRRFGVMVNSGSSANLIMLAAMMETGRLQPGDEVLVPAVSWSTSLFPVAQVGLVPVMVDVHPQSLCMDPASVAAARGPRTKAALAVHLLGQATDMDALDGLLILEDACAAHGAVYRGKKIGGFGEASSFSFFFSHHITTIEGGIVVCDDEELANSLRSLRAHGWIRERSDRAALEAAHPEIDPRFLFVSSGYNLRPTEIQAAFGLVQLGRLDRWVQQRRANHAAWCESLSAPDMQVFPEVPGTEHAGFAFAMLPSGPRAPIQAFLQARGVETRPISGSNLARQPAFQHVPAQKRVPLPVSDAIHERGFFIGNSHAFGPAHGVRIAELLDVWRKA
ncbi:MAG TPA: DegT/DnrJ/EryC1/StrS family aminotransferase [Myxococcota bacterium]|nr:DegT/DnrJ/EryC1/StrS family aminotransferase [Myxococcota bacterium]